MEDKRHLRVGFPSFYLRVRVLIVGLFSWVDHDGFRRPTTTKRSGWSRAFHATRVGYNF